MRLVLLILLSFVIKDVSSQSTICDNIYIWNFKNQNGESTDLTELITTEVEDVLTEISECIVLQRRNFASIKSQYENEQAIINLESINASSLKRLKTIEAKYVIFGVLKQDFNFNSILRLSFENIYTKEIKTLSINIDAIDFIDQSKRIKIFTTELTTFIKENYHSYNSPEGKIVGVKYNLNDVSYKRIKLYPDSEDYEPLHINKKDDDVQFSQFYYESVGFGGRSSVKFLFLLPTETRYKGRLQIIQNNLIKNYFGGQLFKADIEEKNLDTLFNQMSRKFYKFNETYNDYEDHNIMGNWIHNQTIEILHNTDGLLSYKVKTWNYMGGNSPTYPTNFYTYDIINMKLLKLKHIFRNHYKNALRNELIKKLEIMYPEDSLQSFNTEKLITESFYISNKRICFSYDKYEIAAGYRGQITICLDIEDISYLIDDDSSLRRYVDN
jgi:hypothetical protein